MKRYSFLPTLLPALLAGVCLSQSTPGRAQTATAPSAPAKSTPLPAPVNVIGMAAAEVASQLRAGTLAPAAAWEQRALGADEALYILGAGGAQFEASPYKSLRIALPQLLLKHAPVQLEKVESLHPRVKLSLAEYYGSIGDERAVVMFEEVLTASKETGIADLGKAGISRLAEYYQGRGETLKAAETLARMEDYTTQTAWVANSRVGAARLYQVAGEDAKAQELYAKAAQSGFGWAAGVALSDQAGTLMVQGRHEEARKLLMTPVVTGQYAEQTRVASLALLGYSFYQTENFEEARKYSQEAVAQYEALENPLQGEGLQEIVDSAKNRLQILEKWKTRAFEVPLKNLRARRGDDGVYHAKLYLHSFKKQAIEVRFKDETAQLVRLTELSQQRVDSGVVVTIYDLSYRVDAHPARLEARVMSPATSQEQTIELRSQSEDGE